MATGTGTPLVKWFDELGIGDVPLVGGKTRRWGKCTASWPARGSRSPTGSPSRRKGTGSS